MERTTWVGTFIAGAILLAGMWGSAATVQEDSKAPSDSSAVLVGAARSAEGAGDVRPKGLAEAADLAGHAADLLFAPGASDEQVKRGLISLLEAASAAAPSTGIGGDWPAILAAATRAIREGSPVERQAARMLGDCYLEVNGGAPFRMPPEARSLDQVTAYARGRIDSARVHLQQGKAAEGVRRLLEAALTIVTPVEQ